MVALSFLLLSQKVLPRALFFLFSVPKGVGSGLEATPKSLPKSVVSGLATESNAIGSGLPILGLAGSSDISNFIFLPI